MNPFVWIAFLCAFLATVRAQSNSESPCDCRTLQTKLDQLELRVSQISEQLQKKEDRQNMKQQFAIGTSGVSTESFLNRVESNVPSVHYLHTYDYGPDWVVILQRTYGNVSFNRTWNEYRNGFGARGGDFWLGLVKLHQLTKSSPYELLVIMTDLDGNERFARYDRFEIGSEKYRYPIVNLGTHSGSAGDGLAAHTFVGFSTIDKDTSSKCSAQYGNGGWWFCGGGCYESSLTGQWLSNTWSGIVWGKFKKEEKWTKLKSARMMIRAISDGVGVEQV